MASSSRILALGLLGVLLTAWSARADSLTIEAKRLSPPRIISGEPVYIEVTLENRGKEPVILPFEPETLTGFLIIGPDGKLVPPASAGLDVGSTRRVPFAPGARSSAVLSPSLDHIMVTPGAYTITASYAMDEVLPDKNGGPPHWTGRLEAPPIQVAIDPLPSEEEAAFQALSDLSTYCGPKSGFNQWCNPVVGILGGAKLIVRFPRSRFVPHVLYWAGVRLWAQHEHGFGGERSVRDALAYFRKLSAYPDFPLADLCAQRIRECEGIVGATPSKVDQETAAPREEHDRPAPHE